MGCSVIMKEQQSLGFLDLTLEEAELILNALGRRPYIEVVTLIDKLTKQVKVQLEEIEKAKK